MHVIGIAIAAPVLGRRASWRTRWRAAREARSLAVRHRTMLACSVERAVARAQGPQLPWTAAVRINAEAGYDARPTLLDLAERLRGPRPVQPAGVRMVRELLTDGAGPLYLPGFPGALREAAAEALRALDGEGGPTAAAAPARGPARRSSCPLG